MPDTGWISASSNSGWGGGADQYGFDGEGMTNGGTGTIEYQFSSLSSAIPTGAVIYGIELSYNYGRKATPDSISSATMKVYLSKSGTPAGTTKTVASSLPNPVTGKTSGGAADLWGTTWTYTEARGARVNIYAYPNSSTGTGNTYDTADVTSMQIKVTYGDTVPDAFSFTSQSNVTTSTLVTSNTVTPSGYDTATSISVSNGDYRINTGSWGTSPGTINPGDSVTVRHTSSASFSTAKTTTLTIGGVNGTFQSTTEAADTTPSAFTFTDQTGVEPSTVITSNDVTIYNINTSVSVSITGGEYQKNGGSWTSSPGTAVKFDDFRVRLTSSSSYSTGVSATLTVGGTSDTFTATTRAADTTPAGQSISAKTGATTSTVYACTDVNASNYITISGVDAGQNVSFSALGGTGTSQQWRVDSGSGWGSWTTGGLPTNVQLGWKVDLRHTSSGSANTATTSVATVGGVEFTFNVTTAADDDPDDVTFNSQSRVLWSREVESNAVTVSGLTGGGYTTNVALSALARFIARVKKNAGSFSTSETCANTDQLTYRAVASSIPGETATINSNIGSRAESWQITTIPALHHPYEV